MKEVKKDFELEEYDGKPIEYDEDIMEDENESEDIDYSEFNQPNQFDVEEDYNENEGVELTTQKKTQNKSVLSSSTINTLRTFFKWYGYFGIIVALILIATYISRGNFSGLLIYILLLVASYFGGYFLMYAIDRMNG